jgi:hypothetical protein
VSLDVTYNGSLESYTKKVIYCGIRNIVVLSIYYSTLISIQRRNKVVGHLKQGLLTLVKLSLGDWEYGAGTTWEYGVQHGSMGQNERWRKWLEATNAPLQSPPTDSISKLKKLLKFSTCQQVL